jgi:putative membrane protein
MHGEIASIPCGDIMKTDHRQADMHHAGGNRSARLRAYERFLNSEMILRDRLAIDRTVLANERTFLAYFRTVLALILGGATVIRLFEDSSANLAGWILIALGALTGAVGAWRTIRMHEAIRSADREPTR